MTSYIVAVTSKYRVDWLRDGEPLTGAGYLASDLEL